MRRKKKFRKLSDSRTGTRVFLYQHSDEYSITIYFSISLHFLEPCERHKIPSSYVCHEIFPFLELYRINFIFWLSSSHTSRANIRCRLREGGKSLKLKVKKVKEEASIYWQPSDLIIVFFEYSFHAKFIHKNSFFSQ
jgi:hypothetical protein